MSRTRTRSALPFALVLAAALLGLALPAAAPAATLGVAVDDGHSLVRYLAAPGETNRLEVRPAAGGTIAFVDPGATIAAAGPACTQVSAHEARCPLAAAPALGISLGDRDDRVNVTVTKPGLIGGDAGNDELIGGAGDEGLWGGDGDDALDGGGGADLMSGQGGTDTALYATRVAPVTVDLATLTIGQEGQAGERDTVASDVERVTGGAGNDTLTGNDAANLLDGGAGDDAITGGGGADDLRGGPGQDVLRGRDGVADSLNCGADTDAVDADPSDAVAECEGDAPALPAPVPPATLTAPFSFAFGSIALPEGGVTLKRGHVTLSISCPAGTPTGRCTGVVSLERIAIRRHTSKAHSARRTRRFARIGEEAYAVRAGKGAKVRVRISRAGRRAINRTGSLRVKVLLRRTKRAQRATRIGTLEVHASRRTKRRAPSAA